MKYRKPRAEPEGGEITMYDPVQYGQYDPHPEVMAASIRSTQRYCASCARDGGRTATDPA